LEREKRPDGSTKASKNRENVYDKGQEGPPMKENSRNPYKVRIEYDGSHVAASRFDNVEKTPFTKTRTEREKV